MKKAYATARIAPGALQINPDSAGRGYSEPPIIEGCIGSVREWHSPTNEACEHNRHVEWDCTCRRKVTRKAYRTVRVNDPHADRAHLIVAELHMGNGMLVLRQKGRRKRVSVSLGVLYERLVFNEAMRAVREAKAKRKARRAK